MQRPRDGNIIPDGARLGSSANKGLLEKAEEDAGFKAIKLKLGFGFDEDFRLRRSSRQGC
jgi:hypothetical protein